MKVKGIYLRWCFRALILIIVFVNVLAIIHAYKFTHFSEPTLAKTKNPKELSLVEKMDALILGVSNPRPLNKEIPKQSYEIITLKSNKEIVCWLLKTTREKKGTVILFHGYGGEKSAMLSKADAFLQLGYDAMLVDFMGSGESEGNQTTIGFLEAEQVKTCMEYLQSTGENNLVLFGTSMGAVAIMKAVHDFSLNPAKVILECPFGSLYQTVCARFRTMHVPEIPMAGLLVFWGGCLNGFWAFNHNPTQYAKKMNCQVLLFYGAKDEKVSLNETNEIYQNLAGKKELVIFEKAAHENYLNKYSLEWTKSVQSFLEKE